MGIILTPHREAMVNHRGSPTQPKVVNLIKDRGSLTQLKVVNNTLDRGSPFKPKVANNTKGRGSPTQLKGVNNNNWDRGSQTQRSRGKILDKGWPLV